jgi:1-acyl-sn-glycerol-3-phosphate acyltransferase
VRLSQVIPVERGAGLGQPGLLAAERRLAGGDWVHLFPEGTRSVDGRLGTVRRGVGRLYVEAAMQAAEGSGRAPLVVPFVHRRALPLCAPLLFQALRAPATRTCHALLPCAHDLMHAHLTLIPSPAFPALLLLLLLFSRRTPDRRRVWLSLTGAWKR